MPVVVDNSNSPNSSAPSAQAVIEEFLDLIKNFERSKEQSAFLENLQKNFKRFASVQSREIYGQRRILAQQPNALIEQQLQSSVKIFDQTRADKLGMMNEYSSTKKKGLDSYKQSYKSLLAEIKDLPIQQREELLADIDQKLSKVNLPKAYLDVLKANLIRNTSLKATKLDSHFHHFCAWRTLSMAAAELELSERAGGSAETLSERRQIQKLHQEANELIAKLPEKTQREYLVLARRAYESARSYSPSGDDFLSSDRVSIAMDLNRIIPQFDNTSLDIDREPSVGTKREFDSFLKVLEKSAHQREFVRITHAQREVLELEQTIATRQKHVVDTFFEHLNPRQARRIRKEVQRRVDQFSRDDFRAFHYDRPIESRLVDLITGVEVKDQRDPFYGFLPDVEKQKSSEVEEVEQSTESALPKRLQGRFDSMLSELNKLHRLETIVIEAAGNTERDRVAVYKRSADEILGLLLMQRPELAPQVSPAEFEALRVHHIEPMLHGDNSELDNNLSLFARYLSSGAREDFAVNPAEVLIESGKVHDFVENSISSAVKLTPTPENVGNVIADAAKTTSSGLSAFSDSIIKVANRRLEAEPDLENLILPNAKPATIVEAPKAEIIPELPASAPAEFVELREILLSLPESKTEEDFDEMLYNANKELTAAYYSLNERVKSQIAESISSRLFVDVSDGQRDEIIRDLRSLAEAELVSNKENQDELVQEFSDAVLRTYPSPDYKPFGSNHSRLGDVLDEQKSNDPDFDLEEFLDCQLTAIPHETIEEFQKAQSRFREVPKLQLRTIGKGYGEHKREDVKSDIKAVIDVVKEVFSSKNPHFIH